MPGVLPGSEALVVPGFNDSDTELWEMPAA